jgi:hypothetical protein
MIVFDASMQITSQLLTKCNTVTVVIPVPETGGSPVTEYHLIYSHPGGAIQEKTVSENVAILDNVKEGQNYSIQVRARNMCGYGLFSSPLNIETPECLCMLFKCRVVSEINFLFWDLASENTSGHLWVWIIIAITVVAITVAVIVIAIYIRKKRYTDGP